LRKDTRSVDRIRDWAPQVRIGAADASLTSASGVVAVAELVLRLGGTPAWVALRQVSRL